VRAAADGTFLFTLPGCVPLVGSWHGVVVGMGSSPAFFYVSVSPFFLPTSYTYHSFCTMLSSDTSFEGLHAQDIRTLLVSIFLCYLPLQASLVAFYCAAVATARRIGCLEQLALFFLLPWGRQQAVDTPTADAAWPHHPYLPSCLTTFLYARLPSLTYRRNALGS